MKTGPFVAWLLARAGWSTLHWQRDHEGPVFTPASPETISTTKILVIVVKKKKKAGIVISKQPVSTKIVQWKSSVGAGAINFGTKCGSQRNSTDSHMDRKQ